MNEGETLNYNCGYCNNNFKQRVIKKERVKGSAGMGRGSSGSTQVKCPKCNNFLKTWEDGKK